MKESRAMLMLDIVRKSRLNSGTRPLSDEELTDIVEDWLLMLEAIPTERLEDAYHRAMVNRHYLTVLQPGELMASWQVIASSEAEARNLKLAQQSFAERTNQGLYCCPHCFDEGYQHVRIDRGGGYFTYAARGCVCRACPSAQRSNYPLMSPEWAFDKRRGEWERVVPERKRPELRAIPNAEAN